MSLVKVTKLSSRTGNIGTEVEDPECGSCGMVEPGTWDSRGNEQNLSLSVMLSKPILALEFSCLKMQVEAPVVISHCSETSLGYSWFNSYTHVSRILLFRLLHACSFDMRQCYTHVDVGELLFIVHFSSREIYKILHSLRQRIKPRANKTTNKSNSLWHLIIIRVWEPILLYIEERIGNGSEAFWQRLAV